MNIIVNVRIVDLVQLDNELISNKKYYIFSNVSDLIDATSVII